jgi:hypothetical protein
VDKIAAIPQSVPLQERDIIRCPRCGATTTAPCACGVRFHVLKASEAAKLGLQETPNLSDVAIAQRLNIGKDTVRRARAQLAQDAQVETRLGLDGKVRRVPEPRICIKLTPVDISSEHTNQIVEVLETIKNMTGLQRRILFGKLKEKYLDAIKALFAG